MEDENAFTPTLCIVQVIDVPNKRDQILSDERQDPNTFCDF